MTYHFIAIGGAVMHQLAICLKNSGHQITGSDDAIFDPAKANLEANGLLPDQIGWNSIHIHKGVDAVILGMHAKPDNIELLKAQSLNIPIYSFPEFVFQHAKHKKRVVVAGSHGKTTITAMIIKVLNYAQVNFDYLVGSKIEGINGMVKLTKNSSLIIIEGDEYLSSPIDSRSKFLHYHPDIAVISGIAWDHINVFPTFESYKNTFKAFLDDFNNTAQLFYYQPDETLKDLLLSISDNFKHEIYQIPEKRLNNEGQIEINILNDFFEPKVFGDHNFANLNAAAHVCHALGLEHGTILEGLASFSGTANRLETIVRNEEKQFYAIRDFAHAPSKVQATVSAVKQKYPSHHFVAIFELHTYSSLQGDFLKHYSSTLNDADVQIVHQDQENLKIKNRSIFKENEIKDAFGSKKIRCTYTLDHLKEELKEIEQNNTVVLLMSSGHFSGLKIEDWIKG